MMLSTPFSLKLVLENTYPEPYSSIWNQPSLMRSEPEHIDNFSTPNNLFQERKMPPTISLEDIIQLVKKSLISVSIESENSLTTVPVSKVSSSSTQSEEEPDLDSDLSFWKDSQ
jgi:hypothetical protein